MEKLKTAVAQMNVIPGRPDLNFTKMMSMIEEAKRKGEDIIIFPEMSIPGYLLGDEWENDRFIDDCIGYNNDILEASKGITIIWGNVDAINNEKGEDGRRRKYNAAFIAQNGKWISNGVFEGKTYKTNMPKYGKFDDERHYFPLTKLAQEKHKQIESLLEIFEIEINGVRRKIGIILCEDAWSDDYNINPTKILIEKGAEIIINLSCSPWTWRKNNKRNRVIRNNLKEQLVYYIYCNNVGTQNNGKNIFLFDGNSTVYNPDGSISKVANDYREELLSVVLGENTKVKDQELSEERDLEELYNGLIYGIRSFFESRPNKKIVIGLSGGIDSALVATLLTKALGKENIYAVNMPSKFNSNTTKNAALELAKNLGINYGIFPIQNGVDMTINELQNMEFSSLSSPDNKPTKLEISQLTIENLQARDRGSRVLAGITAGLGAIFTNNGNKTEIALGYATLYGDVNGAIAPIGDLYKGEIYKLSKYINEIEGNDIIPQAIINIIPSAELSLDQNVDEGKGDPIIYEYHDKLIRAFVEFRKDPEDILVLFKEGKLEEELKIEKGSIGKYFKNAEEFIKDLEDKWTKYKISVFKRIQSPPIIAVSKRAFGFDLRESQNGACYTRGYIKLKKELCGDNK